MAAKQIHTISAASWLVLYIVVQEKQIEGLAIGMDLFLQRSDIHNDAAIKKKPHGTESANDTGEYMAACITKRTDYNRHADKRLQ
jgi:hypothetical protein